VYIPEPWERCGCGCVFKTEQEFDAHLEDPDLEEFVDSLKLLGLYYSWGPWTDDVEE
jgi:hypothetical protein